LLGKTRATTESSVERDVAFSSGYAETEGSTRKVVRTMQKVMGTAKRSGPWMLRATESRMQTFPFRASSIKVE